MTGTKEKIDRSEREGETISSRSFIFCCGRDEGKDHCQFSSDRQSVEVNCLCINRRRLAKFIFDPSNWLEGQTAVYCHLQLGRTKRKGEEQHTRPHERARPYGHEKKEINCSKSSTITWTIFSQKNIRSAHQRVDCFLWALFLRLHSLFSSKTNW